jgi:hypothetical protein
MARGRCSICERPDRAAIDGALLAGKPFRVVAAQFSVPRATLHAHCKKHVRGVAERALMRATAAYTTDLRCCLRRTQSELLIILSEARKAGNADVALRTAAELRALSESLRKLLTRSVESKRNGKPAANAAPEVELVYQEATRVAE